LKWGLFTPRIFQSNSVAKGTTRESSPSRPLNPGNISYLKPIYPGVPGPFVKLFELSAMCLFDFDDMFAEEFEVFLPPLQCKLQVARILG
jgi:hypothetical protein